MCRWRAAYNSDNWDSFSQNKFISEFDSCWAALVILLLYLHWLQPDRPCSHYSVFTAKFRWHLYWSPTAARCKKWTMNYKCARSQTSHCVNWDIIHRIKISLLLPPIHHFTFVFSEHSKTFTIFLFRLRFNFQQTKMCLFLYRRQWDTNDNVDKIFIKIKFNELQQHIPCISCVDNVN